MSRVIEAAAGSPGNRGSDQGPALSLPHVPARDGGLGTVSFKRGDWMTCVECGAEMGMARRCRRCRAPVPARRRDEAPATRTVSQQAARWSKVLLVLGWTVGVLLNLVALWLVIAFVVVAITEGSAAQEGPNYVPLWACAFIALTSGFVPAVSVVFLAGRRRERQAIISDSPEPLPESLG